ncbi:MAG: ATP-binding cassette domain-containing protein [Bacteroidales bacterium]|nr:ATP-binding cassette domain-containing protein [Bacteroidales bacterium]
MEENYQIKIQDVSIAHDDNLVLSNIYLNIKESEFVYIIGRVGSGKSSLLKALYADISLVSGNIDILDFKLESIKNSQIPVLRRQIGMVFQDFQLLSDRSVKDNLKFVLKATAWKDSEKINNRITEVLEQVDMLAHINKMPFELSGGEQQTIAIARAILNNPPIIFADEPTGNLDPESAETILTILKDLNESGKTIVMVTHNYTLLKKYPARTVLCENKTLRDLPQHEAFDLSDF